MKSVLKPVRPSRPLDSVERILGRYYPQLVEWSRILARGDETAAEEIVQDLCLHLTVAQPDLSGVQNLDSYLFMCLRNMYVSNLARVSRERLRVLHVEDYDAVGIVAARGGLDAVDVQNDLIRIGDYVTSRKYASKSASHFILHFFLGYRRSDVALLARLPISAIYNGLKEIRSELREHLAGGDKIRLLRRGAVPESKLLRAAVSTDHLLKELRSAILDSDPADCFTEKKLVEAYKQPDASPVGCRELAHLAGCERCLNVLEFSLQLDDRDGPLDGIDAGLDDAPKTKETKSFDVTMRLVRRRREQLLQRRPALLAIAVDGRVIAFHAVESAHNLLSSRIDSSPAVHFIEVFDEYGDRLAHIPLDPESAAIPAKQISEQILLSDDRLLRLDVGFDGLGIQAEVDYVDPAFAPVGELEASPRTRKELTPFWKRLWWPGKLHLTPWSAVAFASLMLASVLGIAGYRYMHPGWQDVVEHAQAIAHAPSPAETLNQTLRIEQTIGPERGSVLGSVDVWRSSDKKVVRRLYNVRQLLLATANESGDGTSSLHVESDATLTRTDRQLIDSGVWKSDVSPADFGANQGTGVTRNLSGFELTQDENGRDDILLRTLVLDRSYHVQAERVRFRTADGVVEIRLVQTLLRKVPNRDVPPSTFPQSRGMTGPGMKNQPKLPPELRKDSGSDGGGADLEVAVLFDLFQENADIGQPIEVSQTAGDRVRIAGTVADTRLLAAIRQRIAALADANKVDFQVYSVRDASAAIHRGKVLRQELSGNTNDAPATGLVRDALLARGLKGATLQNAEQEFKTSALAHAQAALQHAYALDRLGTVLRRNDEFSLLPDTRIKWAQMIERHSAIAVTELQVLRLQLDSISADRTPIPSVDLHGITNAAAFARTSSDFRAKAQSVNEEVVRLFAGGIADLHAAQAPQSIARLRATIPLTEADRMRYFAARLRSRDSSEQRELGEMDPR